MTRNPIAPSGSPGDRASSRPVLRLLPPPERGAPIDDRAAIRNALRPARPIGSATVAVAALGVWTARTALRRRRVRREVEALRERAFADLLTAVQLRDEALARASHDLKTPLTALKGQAQLLQRLLRTADTPDRDRLRAGLAAIDAAATRAAARVDTLIGETGSDADALKRGH